MSVFPGVAAVVDDVVEGFENSIRQPVLPHELPDIFLGLSSGARGGSKSGIRSMSIPTFQTYRPISIFAERKACNCYKLDILAQQRVADSLAR